MKFQIETPVKNGFPTYRKLDPKSCANSKTQGGMLLQNPTSDSSMFQDALPEIENLEELLKWLTGLLIHFDTSPQNYIKSDYKLLISIIVKSLIHLYKESTFYVLDSDFKKKIDEIEDKINEESDKIRILEDKIGEGIENVSEQVQENTSDIEMLKTNYTTLKDKLPTIISDTFSQYINKPKAIPAKSLNWDNVEVRFDCGSSTKLVQN